MSMIIRWEEPPVQSRGRKTKARQKARQPSADALTEMADELRGRPGAWAVVFEGDDGPASGMASRIRQGWTPAWAPTGSFEACSRKAGGRTVVYARYIAADGADGTDRDGPTRRGLIAYTTAPLGALTALRKPVLCSRCTEAIGVCGCYEKRLNRLAEAADA